MTVQVGEASPPHRDTAVAEFHVAHDGVIAIPTEMYRHGGKLVTAFYSLDKGVLWEFPLSEFLEAIGKGMCILGV